jgi:hypothetical protein
MRPLRIALALAAAAALGLGSAYAQDTAKPGAKPEAKKEEQHRHGANGQHGHGGKHHRMQGTGGGCHEGQSAEHKHQS